MRNRAVEVLGEQCVASTAEDVEWFFAEVIANGCADIFNRFELQELSRIHLHSEGVVGFEVLVFRKFH